MGMGTHIKPYNEALEEIHQGVFGAFGMDGILTLNVKQEA